MRLSLAQPIGGAPVQRLQLVRLSRLHLSSHDANTGIGDHHQARNGVGRKNRIRIRHEDPLLLWIGAQGRSDLRGLVPMVRPQQLKAGARSDPARDDLLGSVFRPSVDNHDPPVLGVRAQQIAVQRVDPRAHRGVGRRGDCELVANDLEELECGELRIQDQRDLGPRGQLLEQAPDQRRLAGADLAGQLDEAAALGDPVDEVRERVGVPRAHVEIARVGRYRERLLVESEELAVHAANSLWRRRLVTPEL